MKLYFTPAELEGWNACAAGQKWLADALLVWERPYTPLRGTRLEQISFTEALALKPPAAYTRWVFTRLSGWQLSGRRQQDGWAARRRLGELVQAAALVHLLRHWAGLEYDPHTYWRFHHAFALACLEDYQLSALEALDTALFASVCRAERGQQFKQLRFSLHEKGPQFQRDMLLAACLTATYPEA